jgi:hypothetical protein
MLQHLPHIALGTRGNPDPWKTVSHEQVEDMKRIARICLLLPHHRRTDRSRIAHPEFMPEFAEHSLEPLRGHGSLDPDAGGTRKCSVKIPGLPVLVFQSARDHLAGRNIHHCNLLKARVKITSYNQHCRSAPFLRALVEQPLPSLLARREPTTLSNQFCTQKKRARTPELGSGPYHQAAQYGRWG